VQTTLDYMATALYDVVCPYSFAKATSVSVNHW
jgi:hypothetical protein